MTYSVEQYWRGHPPMTDEPAANRLLRTLTVSSGSWQEIDLRTSDYAGAADGLAQNADGQTRGIIRMISVLNNETGTSHHVHVSLYVSGGNPTPANAYNVALTDGPSVELRCPAVHETTRFYLQALSGSAEAQLEIWYDVPPAA